MTSKATPDPSPPAPLPQGERGELPRRRFALRFSLRTLMLGVLALGSGATLWWNWGPWLRAYSFDADGEIRDVMFAEDDSRIAVCCDGGTSFDWTFDIRDARTGARIQKYTLAKQSVIQARISPHYVLCFDLGLHRSLLIRRADWNVEVLPLASSLSRDDILVCRGDRNLRIRDLTTGGSVITADVPDIKLWSDIQIGDSFVAGEAFAPIVRESFYKENYTIYVFDRSTGTLRTKFDAARLAEIDLEESVARNSVVRREIQKSSPWGQHALRTVEERMMQIMGLKERDFTGDQYRLHGEILRDRTELKEARTGRVLLDLTPAKEGFNADETHLEFAHQSPTFASFAHVGVIFSKRPVPSVTVWRPTRPYQWYGPAWLPEFWLMLLFCVGFVWSVWRDQREEFAKTAKLAV